MSEKILSEKLIHEKPISETQKYRKVTFDSALTLAAIIEGFIVVAAACLFATQLDASQRGAFVGTAALVGGASAALGALVGFLFGIPKALQRLDGANRDTFNVVGGPASADQHVRSESARRRCRQYVSNSNLEQISDWLTKILVGVGLVQIGALPAALSRLGAYLKPSFGNLDSSPAFAIGLVISVFLIAFMLEYMWTRTRFLQLLDDYSGDSRYDTIGHGDKLTENTLDDDVSLRLRSDDGK